MEMMLDNVTIFKGEISQACGVYETDTDALGDVSEYCNDQELVKLLVF